MRAHKPPRRPRLAPALVLALGAASGAGATPNSSADAASVPTREALLSMDAGQAGPDAAKSEVERVRARAVREAAETYAAQSAYCHALEGIHSDLMARQDVLDRTYDFASVLLSGGRVLPPVIEQAEESYVQQSRIGESALPHNRSLPVA